MIPETDIRTCIGCKTDMTVTTAGQTVHPCCAEPPRLFTPDPGRRYMPGQLTGEACVECNGDAEHLPTIDRHTVGTVDGHDVFACSDCLWRFTP